MAIKPHSDNVGMGASAGLEKLQQKTSICVWSFGMHAVSTSGLQGISPRHHTLMFPVPFSTGPPGPPGPQPACFLPVQIPTSYPFDSHTYCAHEFA
jgi:hypothetical protein